MARSEEEKKLTATRTNVTKWTNAIEKYSGGTEVYSVLGQSKESWESMHPKDQWELIAKFKEGKKDLKLERNKRTFSDSDYKRLLKQIAEAKSDDKRKELLDVAKMINEYDNAKSELESAQSALDKAKDKLKAAKRKFDTIEETLEKMEIL